MLTGTLANMVDTARKMDPTISYACGFVSGMQKILPKDVDPACDTDPEGNVELAGNETESIQLLIYAFEQDLEKTAVEVGPVVSADGKSVSSGITVQASPVGFVKTGQPPYEVKYVGWYPDPILDFLRLFDIKQGDVQPVWIRVRTQPGFPAGDYHCDLTVKPANAAPYKIDLNMHVWGFDVPEERHLRTAMSLYDSFLAKAYGTETDEMRMKYEDFFLDYRINPDNIYRASPPKIDDLERWDKLGLNAFNLIYVQAIKDMKPGEPYPEEELKKVFDNLDSIIPQLKEKGLYEKAYLYGFDEINSDTFFAMKDAMEKIKTRYPDLCLMTTAFDASYGEDTKIDAIDAWVPLTPSYDKDRADRARARGKQVWWYICCEPVAPYANWFIEYDAIDTRSLMGMQTAKYEPDGFLYYAMMRWPHTTKPITDGPYTDWPPVSFEDFNGDGSIACAGPDGPLATIRLENIRDGIEDYEYFRLLREEIKRLKAVQGNAADDALKQAEDALIIGDDVVESTTKFSKDPNVILAKRRQVAEAILAARKVK